jgi:lysophospholipase L1-like esterase
VGLGTAGWRRGWSTGVAALCLLAVTTAPVGASVPDGSPEASGPAHYVALGDSYTSGPGIPNQSTDSPGCRRSDHDYPHLVAAALEPARFTDVSCAGARTADMASRQPLPGGLTNGPQLDALDAGVDLVSLGIGGNDIRFGEIAVTCAGLSVLFPLGAPCRHHYGRHGDEVGARLAAAAPQIAAVLAAIRHRAPAARILLVGYPVILPAAGPGCWPVMPIAVGDVAWLRGVEGRLNATLADLAAGAGATYVDTYASSVGHDVCRLPGRKWVEGFVPTAPASAVHPNALGMANTADQVLAAL